MTAEWYYRTSKGRAEGPVTAARLKELARLGEIRPETEIGKNGESQWITANKVKGLLDAVPTKPHIAESAPLALLQPFDDGNSRKPSRSNSSILNEHRSSSDTNPTVSSSAKQWSPLLLVGAGVGGTSLVVALAFVAFLMFSKKDESKLSQQHLVENAAERKTEERPKEEPSQANTDLPPAVGKVISQSPSTPDAAVKAYLAAETWEARLPHVLDPDRVRPKMANNYRNTPTFKAGSFLPGTILSVENENVSVGGKCTVSVDVSKSYPKLPRWRYIVVRTSQGFKVDWEASQEQSEVDQKEAFQAELRKLNPVIDIEVLRCKQSYSHTEFEFRLTNKSTVLFSYVAVTMSIRNGKDEYLGNDFTNSTNVRAGQSIIKSINFDNVKVGEVASWKMDIKDVTIDRGDGKRTEATTVFKMNEQIAGSGKGYQRRLESRLVGHWRASDWHYYFLPNKPDATFVDKEGGQHVYSYTVMERNYSTGAFQLRFVSANGTGQQRTFTIKDQNVVISQPTHLSVKIGDWREMKDEITEKLTEEWTYVDQRVSP